MKRSIQQASAAVCFAAFVMAVPSHALAQKQYGPGVSDTEIKIGNTTAYSGPVSNYSLIATTQAAYFKKINDEGGINGRKINFISYDDAASPPKTVEQTRKLVENDEVLLVFQALSTASNSAVQKYLNLKKVPQLFVGSGASKWADPENFPWSMGWQPNYKTEGVIYAEYLLKNRPDAKIAVLYQKDDYGKDTLAGLKKGLGEKAAAMIVAEASYELQDPTIDAQIVTLRSSNADVFVDIAAGKFAAQAIRKVNDLGWKPMHIMNAVGSSIGSVLKPAGLEISSGLVTVGYMKDPSDPAWENDPGMKEWHRFMDKYLPSADRSSSFTQYGYSSAQALVQVLKQCGDVLTRENVMRQAASLRDVELPLMLPGIKMNTSATDYSPLEDLQMMRFDGAKWDRFGPVISGNLN